jgi:hypothetical protein
VIFSGVSAPLAAEEGPAEEDGPLGVYFFISIDSVFLVGSIMVQPAATVTTVAIINASLIILFS